MMALVRRGLAFTVQILCLASAAPASPQRAEGAPPGAVAVVELFTSEGCSSCPPADTVLADLAADPRVYPLSFHVDYWNDLGWRDAFSSPDFSARQRFYETAFHAHGIYTPQMVVNGLASFVGSDRASARRAIAEALAHPSPLAIGLRVQWSQPQALSVVFDAPSAPGDALLDVALVERFAATVVRAGENAGRTLRHTNVVRAFVVVHGERSGARSLAVPPDLRAENAEVVAFVQRLSVDPNGAPVLGASRAPLPAR